MDVIYCIMYGIPRKRFLLPLGFSLLAFCSVIANPSKHHSIFREVFDLTNNDIVKDTVAGYDSLLDPIFHICSMDVTCIYVVKDKKTGKFSTYQYKSQMPLYRDNLRVWEKQLTKKGTNLKVRISSIGNDDDMFLGSSSMIAVNEVVFHFKSKGIHSVILSSEDGQLIKKGSFDTVDDPQSSFKLISFLDSCPKAAIVLLSTFDDASVYLTDDARKRLASLGADSKIGFRDSFALVTQKGTLQPDWFMEGHATAGAGPINIAVLIEL